MTSTVDSFTGNIPSLSVNAANLPEAWEKAVLAVWQHGAPIKTEYDKPADPPSKRLRNLSYE